MKHNQKKEVSTQHKEVGFKNFLKKIHKLMENCCKIESIAIKYIQGQTRKICSNGHVQHIIQFHLLM